MAGSGNCVLALPSSFQNWLCASSRVMSGASWLALSASMPRDTPASQVA